MCGIAGLLNFNRAPAPGSLAPVMELLAHRGPDGQGTHAGENILFGHTRLAVLDLTDMAAQPMRDEETGNIITYNGEIYNFRRLRSDLVSKGHSFVSTGDTEVLLKLYAEYGQDCLNMLEGMFAFAIWDDNKQHLFMARDRLGKKPLCYAETDQGFIFASEVRALAAHPAISDSISAEAIDLYLFGHAVPAPRSIYRDIRKLLPGHCMVIDRDGCRVRQYWSLDLREKIDITEEEALDRADQLLQQAVQDRLVSDVPLGLLLSGGIDSSLVAAHMSALSPRTVQAFTIGFENAKFDESAYARQCSETLGLNLNIDVLPSSTLEALPGVAERFGEPFSDDSSIAIMLLTASARKKVTVALNGDGGDELAMGYSRYTHVGIPQLLNRFIPAHPYGMDILERLTPGPFTSIIRRYVMPELKPLLKSAQKTRRILHNLYTPEMHAEVSRTFIDEFARTYHLAFEHASNPAERLLWTDANTTLPDTLLVKADIASMTHSLEGRSPFLDHRLHEFFATLPPELKIRGGESKYLLKKLAERYFPKDFVYRRKQGFSMPVEQWLRDQNDFVMDVLETATPCLVPILDMDKVKQLARAHDSGRGANGKLLWKLLNLALWRISVK